MMVSSTWHVLYSLAGTKDAFAEMLRIISAMMIFLHRVYGRSDGVDRDTSTGIGFVVYMHDGR